MTRKEWPLVFFTLLIQMAVGTMLALTMATLLDQPPIPQDGLDLLRITLPGVIPPILILGVLSAGLHLARPVNAKLAMTNVKQSWLSREMLLGLAFGLLSSTLWVFELLKIGSPAIYSLLLLAGTLSGILLLYGMSRIYMLRTVPSWNTWATPVSFFTTATLFGALILSIAASRYVQTVSTAANSLVEVEEFLHWMGWGSAILLSFQLLVTFLRDRYLIWKGGVSRESIQSLKQRYPILGFLRAVFGILAIGLCALFALQPLSSTAHIFQGAIAGAFLLALASETIGRFLFYASHKRSGL